MVCFQTDVLSPGVPEQVAVRGHGQGQRAHRQHRVFRSVRIRHHVEQGYQLVRLS